MPADQPIDVTFDIRSDAGGKDPDRYSATLRGYHRQLWGKPLPNGAPFPLDDVYPKGYLQHQSELGEFMLSSDMIHRSFIPVVRMRHVIEQVPQEVLENSSRNGCTVGGTIVFPAHRIEGKHTINQARGTHRRIEDRFDLTLECIRRHYEGAPSPLTATLARYASFFDLFDDFEGYVAHFLLQDLVDLSNGTVRFFTKWQDFDSPAMPQTVTEYLEYSERAVEFVLARNRRISAWAETRDDRPSMRSL
ncbi:hypothetical protein [Microbacterium sp. NC79]|uniref:DUF6994 family protein n=1 Tax=Microbacterium sp. NC79 TaxID=2851009 RepID=UPI001C2C293D|nr:hypothetical protein [Microbacterium sp. NC79]MBV0896103.1 hypothetical protein [Microbacterium sp. NC79]